MYGGLSPDQQKEQFSGAYVRALATIAGYTMTRPDVDDDSVDFTISSRNAGGRVSRPKLDIQLKCTESPPLGTGVYSYPLKKKNYDDLRDSHVMVPRILVVVRVPATPEPWIDEQVEHTTLRHIARWVSLRGLEESPNEVAVNVHLPAANRFDVTGLQAMMGRIATGGLP